MKSEVRISGLSTVEQLELEKQLGKSKVSFEKAKLEKGLYGELVTATAIVAVSLAALRVLAIYIVQKKDREIFRTEIEIVAKDGSRKKVKIQLDTASSEAPAAQVLKQLAAACDVDADKLLTK